MTRKFAALACVLTIVPLAAANTKLSNPLIHPAWIKSLDRASALADQGEVSHALALVSGGLYVDGVTIGMDGRSAKSPSARRAFQRAVRYWQSALGDDCPLRVVDGSASVNVVMVDSISAAGDELGLIEMKKNYQWSPQNFSCLTTAKISIVRSFGGSSLSEDELTETMAHEMGHLLGLADVEDVGYLMGPMDRARLTSGPTSVEVNAIQEVRQAFRQEMNSLSRLVQRRRD
jgi:Zn-dependent protease with chaperone function